MHMIQTDLEAPNQPTDGWDEYYANVVTEDDTPVDNRFSERQQHLLPEILFQSWPEGKPFEAISNVGLFYSKKLSPIVPDFMLSLAVEPMPLTKAVETKSYFVWEYGKPPDLVVEVVSNQEGGEDSRKLEIYARIRVTYYVIYDPLHYISPKPLRCFRLDGGRYKEIYDTEWLPEIGLGLALWQGLYNGIDSTWLRFVNQDGVLLPTADEANRQSAEETRLAKIDVEAANSAAQMAKEQAELAQRQVQTAQQQAQAARQQAQDAKEEAERIRLALEASQQAALETQLKLGELEAKLRELGIEP